MQRRSDGSTEASQIGGASNLSSDIKGIKTTPDQQGPILPVGIYLGPGAIRAYAHLGVLKILEKAQVPIVAIGGMEWGSLVAAGFAASKSANEAEWEMMKLQENQLPKSTLLNRRLTAKDPGDLFSFLRFAFNDRELQNTAIPFSCPATDGEDTVFISQGKARDELIRCLALPPLYNAFEKDGHRWTAAAVAPGDWAGLLRNAGAKYIIYIDVISKGTYLDKLKYSNDDQIRTLWSGIKSSSKLQHQFANITIEVAMDIDLADFDKRREAVSIGERAGNSSLNDVLKGIGFVTEVK